MKEDIKQFNQGHFSITEEERKNLPPEALDVLEKKIKGANAIVREGRHEDFLELLEEDAKEAGLDDMASTKEQKEEGFIALAELETKTQDIFEDEK